MIRALRTALAAMTMVGVGACSSDDPAPVADRPAVTQAGPTTTEADPLASVVEREKGLAAMRQQFELLEKGDWAGAWALLHPAQQAALTQADFTRCATKRWGTLDVKEVHLDKVTSSTNDVPGTPEKGPGFRMEVRVVGEDGSGPFDALATYMEFKVADAFRWAVKDPAAYQGGQCPPDDDSLR